MHGVYFSFSAINIMLSKRKRSIMRFSAKHTRNSSFAAGTDGSSHYGSSYMSSASMEQVHSLSTSMLCTQLKRCSLPTSGNKVRMTTLLHHYFHTFQGTPTVNPDNAVVPPQDPNGQQQQATETSPPAGNNLFSQQFANQLSPGNNLFSQQFASQFSNQVFTKLGLCMDSRLDHGLIAIKAIIN